MTGCAEKAKEKESKTVKASGEGEAVLNETVEFTGVLQQLVMRGLNLRVHQKSSSWLSGSKDEEFGETLVKLDELLQGKNTLEHAGMALTPHGAVTFSVLWTCTKRPTAEGKGFLGGIFSGGSSSPAPAPAPVVMQQITQQAKTPQEALRMLGLDLYE